MVRPTNKDQLQVTTEREWYRMWQLIRELPENAELSFMVTAGKERHWQRDHNVRDILIHLYEWHELLLKWVTKQQQGLDTPFLPAPYTWKTYGELNDEFWRQHQTTSYEEAKNLVTGSHEAVLALLMQFDDEELFTKKYYSWTGTTNLASYFISALSSHYNWAGKKLHKQLKLNQKECDNSR